MGLHFVLCSMEKSEKHSHSECIGYFYLFIYFQFLRRCFKDANVSAIIQNPMAKPVVFLSRESRATLTSGLANISHPSTTLYCKNTCSSWMRIIIIIITRTASSYAGVQEVCISPAQRYKKCAFRRHNAKQVFKTLPWTTCGYKGFDCGSFGVGVIAWNAFSEHSIGQIGDRQCRRFLAPPCGEIFQRQFSFAK